MLIPVLVLKIDGLVCSHECPMGIEEKDEKGYKLLF